MNKLLFILTMIPLLELAQGNTQKNDCQLEGLLGNVKEVKQNLYGASEKFGEVVQGNQKESSKDNYLKQYNEIGFLTEWVIYEKMNEKFQKHIYQYNDSLKSKEENLYRPDGSLDWKYIYKYDGNKNLTEENWYAPSGVLCRKGIYKYDAKGNMAEAKYYNTDGHLESKYIYSYDDQGNKQEETKYNASGDLVKKYLLKYNKGLLIENREYKSNGKLKWSITYEYNEKGSLIEKNEYKADGSLDFRQTYSYEYDKTGNWTKRTNRIGKEITIITRQITYY